ncbi:MAG: hypothetical protein R3208_08590 [Ketobacteraceae bacterium]|nr:hypothetical protein [Ketobacteraceae bacterium]
MNFEPRSGMLLDIETESVCKMEVRENSEYRWMVGSDGVIHGVMDKKDPFTPVTSYLQAMLTALALHPNAKSLLSLGLGCGSLERYLAQAFPHIGITTVEVSQARIDQVMSHFSLPEKVVLVTENAVDYVENCAGDFDVIFCDIFGSIENPCQNQSERFYENCMQSLTRNGVFVINFTSTQYEPLVDTLVKVRKHFKATGLLEVPGHSNVIVFACLWDRCAKQTIDVTSSAEHEHGHPVRARLNEIYWLPRSN